MAHYAKLDENNIVVRVTIGNNEHEDEGYQWLIDNLGGRWVKTSFNSYGGVHYTDDEEGNRIPSGNPHLRYNFAGIGYFYDEIEDAFIQQTNWDLRKGRPYVIEGSKILEKRLESNTIFKGFTGTAGGFYGPQGRVIRLGIQDPELNSKMDRFNYNGIKMTNLEMETGAIYGLGKLMGHNCLSLNAIIANRATGTFSEDPYKAVDELIIYTLNKLVE